MKTPVRAGLTALLVSLFLTAIAGAESYRSVQVAKLKFGAEPGTAESLMKEIGLLSSGNWQIGVRSGTEAYFDSGASNTTGSLNVVFRFEDEVAAEGFLDLPGPLEGSGNAKIVALPFTLDAAAAKECSKEAFEKARAAHFARLAGYHLPGTAWFRHRAAAMETPGSNDRGRDDGLAATFGIFGGGRAISENLALDRELIVGPDDGKERIPLAEIVGITVPAIDWTTRLPAEPVPLDALAAAVPADQHAVFAKNLPDLLALMERLESDLPPLAQDYSVRSPYRRLLAKYRAQMGLDFPPVAARLLPVKSVALTGGDPFLPLGSDVAMVFESASPDLLYQALLRGIAAKAAAAGADAVTLEGADFAGFENAGRSFSSYIQRIGDRVAISNSAKQIERLAAVAENPASALGATDEFRYFRSRYPLADDESAFVFLSDAAIRRWAGPELRIAASRRTRALAAMSELTSQVLAGENLDSKYDALLGAVKWQDGKILSADFGSLDFLKPASELAVTDASAAERAAYDRWRSGYESGWTQVFDPIAIRLKSDKSGLDLDLSLMPLTVGSDFGELVKLCGNAQLSPMAERVPDDSLLHLAIALDTKAELFRNFDSQAVEMLPGVKVNPLGWLAGPVSLDLGESVLWESSPASFEDNQLLKAPAVLRIESNSRLKLALFMTGLKAAVSQSAPDSLTWNAAERGGRKFVRVTPEDGGMSEMRLAYATMPKALLIALDEDALLRAMDRENAKPAAGEIAPPPTQLRLDIGTRFAAQLAAYSRSSSVARQVQQESWKALPILNEWHRKFPDKDPVAVEMLHYGTDIFCPGGRGYRWNAAEMTMESVAYGHPAAPRDEPVKIRAKTIANIRTGLKFQDGGLRARITLGDAPPRFQTPKPAVEPVELATAASLTPLIENRKLTYQGNSKDGKVSMTLLTREIRKDGDAATLDVLVKSTDAAGVEISHTCPFLLDGALTYAKIESLSGEAFDYTTPELALPEKLIVGATVVHRAAGIVRFSNGDGPVEMPYKSIKRIETIRLEDVTVPAGTFSGCVRVESRTESLTGSTYGVRRQIGWYHPGTGLVKMQELSAPEGIYELSKIEIVAPDN